LRKTLWIWPPLLALLFPAAANYWPFNFNALWICERCAMTRESRERQLPMIYITLWTSHSNLSDTRLSRYLREESLVGSHEHAWRFEFGAGNGTLCAINRGRDVHRIAEDEDVLRFLRFLKERERPETLQRWLSFLLCDRTAAGAKGALHPLDNYPTLDQGWWNERGRTEAERLRQIEESKRYFPDP
jgi:hypothetical protein